VFGFGAAFFVAVLVAISAAGEDERGGEGGRPVEGVCRDSSGKERFSRGFLNIRKLVEHDHVGLRCSCAWECAHEPVAIEWLNTRQDKRVNTCRHATSKCRRF
jgi:hypothetical protein